MKSINQLQMDKMEQLARQRYYRKLSEFLRLELPDEVESMTDDELCIFIINQEARASRLDILSQASVAQYICLALVYGEDFVEKPDVRNLFAETSEFSSEDKLDFLFDAIEEEDASSVDDDDLDIIED